MLRWVELPADVESSIFKLFVDMNLFFRHLYEEIILPTNNQELIDSFKSFFDILVISSAMYESTQKDIDNIESIIANINTREKTTKTENLIKLLEEIIDDLSITYLNISVIIGNKEFNFQPDVSLPANELIKILNNAKDDLTPQLENLTLQRNDFIKYFFELTYLNEKLLME